MSKFNGGGSAGFGGGNMQQLMRQAQKMQQDMLKAQEELSQTEITATSGGGAVTVTMTCDKKLVGLKIKPEVVDVDDVEMLEDIIIAGINEAYEKAESVSQEKMGPLSGGMGMF